MATKTSNKAETASAVDNGAVPDEMVFVAELPEETHTAERSSKYATAVEKLSANPGMYGRVFVAKDRNGARTRCYQLRKRFPAIEWEFRGFEVWGRAAK